MDTRNYRGYGWEYIDATTSITKSEIENVLENARESDIIRENGEIRYIIGEGASESEKVILSIIGGVIVAADTTDHTIEGYELDPCYDVVWFREHAVRDKKPINDMDRLKKLFEEKVVKTLQSGGERYYIIEVAENSFIILTSQPIGSKLKEALDISGRLLMTMLTGEDGGFYDSREEAEKDTPKDATEIEPPDC